MKEFASTVYYYSPKAYGFLRSKFKLPDEATLRRMISQNSCEAGFVPEVFAFLKNESLKSNFVKDVALIIDGMSIRSKLTVDQKENCLCGYVDYGKEAKYLNIDFDDSELATEMLAFQIVSYSNRFKLPIAHFFIKRMNVKNQAILINEAVKRLYNVGVTVRSVTCDGTSTNFSTLQFLGCDFNFNLCEKPRTFFKHAITEDNIYVIMDPCHMLKLCRNTLAEKNLYSPDGIISFQYIKQLNKIQDWEGFKFANKLSSSHINYNNKKMKVSLAAQTISSGVADAIDYLRLSGHPLFQGSEATCKFIRIFDMLFDMFNIRNVYGKGFRSPISSKNIEYWVKNAENSINYILTLTLNNKPVIQSNRKVFAVGFLIDVYSFQDLARDLLTKICTPLKYFLTYKCSQDHIELYFCCIRSRGGWNNNPTILQILWSIRRLLYRNSVTASINANCLTDADNETVSILEFRSKKRNIIESEQSNNDIYIEKLVERLESINLSCYQENILFYITGYIVDQFIKNCTCIHCTEIVISRKSDHNYSRV